MTVSSRERFAAAVRGESVDLAAACLLLAADFDEGLAGPGALDRWETELASLAARVPAVGTPEQRLRVVLGDFGGTATDYGDLRSSLLHEVLRRRRGLPILLSVVWTEVARRVGIEAHGIGLPGHFVVLLAAADGASAVLVDPFAGGTEVSIPPDGAVPWGPVETLERILANIRRWADRPERVPVRLRAVELALLLPRHDAALRREHGELLARTGDFLGGAAELEAYAEVVEAVDPTVAEASRASARSARAQLN